MSKVYVFSIYLYPILLKGIYLEVRINILLNCKEAYRSGFVYVQSPAGTANISNSLISHRPSGNGICLREKRSITDHTLCISLPIEHLCQIYSGILSVPPAERSSCSPKVTICSPF